MVVLAAIVIDALGVSVLWWATVAWKRRRQTVSRYERELAATVRLAHGEPRPAVSDVSAVAEQQTIGSAPDSARELVPATRGAPPESAVAPGEVTGPSTPGDHGPTSVSEMLRARLLAIRDTPGLSVALEINGTADPADHAGPAESAAAGHDPAAAGHDPADPDPDPTDPAADPTDPADPADPADLADPDPAGAAGAAGAAGQDTATRDPSDAPA